MVQVLVLLSYVLEHSLSMHLHFLDAWYLVARFNNNAVYTLYLAIGQPLCFAFVSRSVKLFSLDDLVRKEKKDRISQNILHHARTCTMDDTRHTVYVKAVTATNLHNCTD